MKPVIESFEGLYDIRDMQPDDKNFILATFLRGLYYGDSWFTLIPKAIFMSNYKGVAEHLVSSPKVTVKVACLKDEPGVILGYVILSADFQTVHWTFVKSAWRGKGIAKSLVPRHPAYCSHLSTLGLSLMKSKFPNTVFNPFQLGV